MNNMVFVLLTLGLIIVVITIISNERSRLKKILFLILGVALVFLGMAVHMRNLPLSLPANITAEEIARILNEEGYLVRVPKGYMIQVVPDKTATVEEEKE